MCSIILAFPCVMTILSFILREDMSITDFAVDNAKTPLFLRNKRARKYVDTGSVEMGDLSSSNDDIKTIGKLGKRLIRRKKLIQWRRWIIDMQFALALFGILLMIIETELYIADHISKAGIVSFYIKLIISISTACLLIAIWIGYYLGAQIRSVDAGVKNWLSVMTTYTWCALAFELFLCAIHPFPGDIKSNYKSPYGVKKKVSIDAVASILMLTRLYLVAKFAVVHSMLLTDTSTTSIGALSRVKINTMFVFKAAMSKKPGILLMLVMVCTFLCNSWAMRTCELYYEKNSEKNSYLEIMWLVAITFLTIGYGDRTPQSYCGRYISIVTGIMGVITTALLVAIITRKLEQTRAERYVFNFVNRLQNENKKKTSAANAIKALLRISILKKYGKDYIKEIRNYEDKLKQCLKEMRTAMGDKYHIGDEAVGMVDIAHEVSKIEDIIVRNASKTDGVNNRVASIELRLDSIDKKLDFISKILVK